MAPLIGIDLGTTNSVAAFMDNGAPRIIPNNRGNLLTPSVVAFTKEGEILVGESAKNQAVINADRTVRLVKRFIGTGKTITVSGKRYTPEYISSLILKKMKDDAETFLGEEVKDVVVSIPAHFNEHQRRGTKKAGSLAGLRVRSLINEPTAAALAYAVGGEASSNILVYDFGGGTFDSTLLRREGKTFHVLSTNGDGFLGGSNFDEVLVQKAAEWFKINDGIDIRQDNILVQQVREHVENAKIELSSRDSATIALPFISMKGSPMHLSCTIERIDFEREIDRFLRQTMDITLKTVKEGGCTPKDINVLILAGGSSRIPRISRYLHDYFSLLPKSRINPEEVVALGTAVQASIISAQKEREGIQFRDVMSHSLGVEVDDGRCIRIVEKNTRIPLKNSRIFTTVENFQRVVEIHVLQGEDDRASKNVSLGRFTLSGIKGDRKGSPHIEVLFSVDEDGIVSVNAVDRDTLVKQSITLLSSGQSEESARNVPEMIERVNMLKNSIEHAFAGQTKSLPREFQQEIEAALEGADRALSARDKGKIHEYRIVLEALVGELRTALHEEKKTGYEQA